METMRWSWLTTNYEPSAASTTPEVVGGMGSHSTQ